MIPARRVYAILGSVTHTYSSLAYAVEFALQDRNPGPRDVYDTFFRFQEAFNGLLEDLPFSEILPDSSDFTFLNMLLDQWLQLTGTVDMDIARYARTSLVLAW